MRHVSPEFDEGWILLRQEGAKTQFLTESNSDETISVFLHEEVATVVAQLMNEMGLGPPFAVRRLKDFDFDFEGFTNVNTNALLFAWTTFVERIL